MKKKFQIIAVLLCGMTVMAQPFNQEISKDGKSAMLLGKINEEGLLSNSLGEWFLKNHTAYQPNSEITAQLKNELSEYTIKLFMGTWCGDSKREVPRFYKVLEESNFPMERLTAVAVDRGAKTYKQSPGGEHEGLNIHRVPTFIIYKDGQELNRIVEEPVNTIEEDLLAIIQDNYTPNYHTVTLVDTKYDAMGPQKFNRKAKKVAAQLKASSNNWYELGTYSHVLFTANKKEKVIAVSKLNTLLFPSEAGAHVRVGNQLSRIGREAEALTYYQKALELDPNNKQAKAGLESINSKA